MSVGIASLCEFKGLNTEELYGLADKFMYKDKMKFYEQSGKNRRKKVE